jgi:hypothetical protein
MAFPSYKPLTQHDHKYAILAMALGAAWFTVVAASYHEPQNPADEHVSWPAIISPFVPFFGGFSWLVLDSWYHGRAWWLLLFWSGGGFGVSRLLGFAGFWPIVLDLWAWTGSMAVVVFMTGYMGEGGEDEDAALATSCVDDSVRLVKAGEA